jgi:hypothetical protein
MSVVAEVHNKGSPCTPLSATPRLPPTLEDSKLASRETLQILAENLGKGVGAHPRCFSDKWLVEDAASFMARRASSSNTVAVKSARSRTDPRARVVITSETARSGNPACQFAGGFE